MKKILLCVGEGLGNVIETLPLGNAFYLNNIDFDILNLSNQQNETVSWLYSKYAKVLGGFVDVNAYTHRIELATTLSNPKYSERINIPVVNNTNKQFIYTQSSNEIEIYLLAASDLRLSITNDVFDITFDLGEEQPEYDFIVHNGGSRLNNHMWERKKYRHMGELVEKLISLGYSVASIGNKDEFTGGDNKTGLTIKETASLINKSKFFISNDTGTYHLAAALKKDGIVLFTATSTIKNYHPVFHKTIKCVNKGIKCQPCQYRCEWNKCTENTYNKWECQDIPVDKIIKEINNANVF